MIFFWFYLFISVGLVFVHGLLMEVYRVADLTNNEIMLKLFLSCFLWPLFVVHFIGQLVGDLYAHVFKING
jgi:hypothetical protein